MIPVLPGLLVLAVTNLPRTAIGAAAPVGVMFRDQYGNADSLSAHAGVPQVVFVVAADRLRRIKEWEIELTRRLDGVGYLRVADVPVEVGHPEPDREAVAATLRRHVPPGVRVLIDTDRRWANDLGLDTRDVSVLLFDAGGALLGLQTGRPRLDALRAVEERLCALPGVRRRDGGETPGGSVSRENGNGAAP